MASREAGTGPPAVAESGVLVVDDEPDVASVTAAYLERHLEDITIVVETGGEAAIDRFDVDIDCVVSDYEMPGVDGLELLRRIRASQPDLPFILFTARGSEEIASDAISAGVTDYLQKGVGTDQYEVLANRIENAIARRESEATAAETEARYQRLLESSPHAIAVHDGDGIRFVNDRFREIVDAPTAEAIFERDPLDLIHPEDRQAVADRMRRVLAGERLGSWSEWRLRRLDGEVRHVESRAAPVRFEGQAASQVVLRVVIERRRHERRLRALHDAMRRLLTASDPTAIGAITLDIIEEVFEQPVACIWKYDPAAGELVQISSSESVKELALADGLDTSSISLPAWTVEMSVFEAGEQRVVTDYGERNDTVPDVFETVLMDPLDRHGLLTVAAANGDGTFDDSDRDLIGILARSVAAAFDRACADPGTE